MPSATGDIGYQDRLEYETLPTGSAAWNTGSGSEMATFMDCMVSPESYLGNRSHVRRYEQSRTRAPARRAKPAL